VAEQPIRPVTVAKTFKLYVNGALVRSESGATFPVAGLELPDASRKDVRDAVRAGANAAAAWAARDAYNRGQVIYRVAEMLETRADEFVALADCLGVPAEEARSDVRNAVDVWVHYAGWPDKIGQVFGVVNDVSGPFVSYTSAQPLGLVAVVLDPQARPALTDISAAIASALAAGNSVIVVGGGAASVPLLEFAEVLATSDVPPAAVQLMTSTRLEAARTLATASQVMGLDLSLAGEQSSSLALAASETFTRTLRRLVTATGADRLRWQLERRTLWHPTAR
jgi:acyl-CoA reductase-like NAD-dependent aldehyde dehydrogenase